jgi:hypothetical protein
MSRKPGKLGQGDLNRIIKAAKLAGAPVVTIDYGDGVSVTVPLQAATNDLDRELQEFERRNGSH